MFDSKEYFLNFILGAIFGFFLCSIIMKDTKEIKYVVIDKTELISEK